MKKLIVAAVALLLSCSAPAYSLGAFGQYEFMDDEFKDSSGYPSVGLELGFMNNPAYSFLSLGSAGSDLPLYLGIEGGLLFDVRGISTGAGIILNTYLYDERQTRTTINPDTNAVTREHFRTRAIGAVGGTVMLPIGESVVGRVAAYIGGEGPIFRLSVFWP